MALATPLITFTDGAGNASQSPAAFATAFVTPGNVLTVTLASSTGVLQYDAVIVAPGTPLDGYRPARMYSSPFTWSVQLPQAPMSFTLYTEVFDGNNISVNTNVFNSFQKTAGQVHRARNVVTSNVASLASFTVAGNDGVTNVQGDVVLLVNQSTASQNGPYYVGAVATGVAPLTRVPDFASGTVFSSGQPQVCELGPDGTTFGSGQWKITTTGAITVDTTNHAWFPRVHRGTGATGGGTTIALTTLWALATTSTMLAIDVSGAAAVQAGAIVAGAGTGTCTLTGTTAHTINWMLTNY